MTTARTPKARIVRTQAHLTMQTLALLLHATKLEAYSQGYRDAQPTPTYAEAKAGS